MPNVTRARRWWLLAMALMPLACRGGPAGPRVVRVAVVQLWGQPDQLDGNVAKAVRLIRDAAAARARYIVLPELYALFVGNGTTEPPAELRRKAQPLSGPLTTTMLSLARELEINIAYGMPERRGEEVYNSVVFVEPKGVAGVYSKRFLVTLGPPGGTEADTFTRGGQLGALTWNGIETGALICADVASDFLWQRTLDQGVQLMVVPSAGFDLVTPGQPTIGDRARRYGVPVVLANHWRPAEGFIPYGGSQIADAAGTVLQNAGNKADQVIVADVQIPERRRGTTAHR